MKIVLKNALELKNELAKAVARVTFEVTDAECGETWREDEEQPELVLPFDSFPTVFEKLQKLHEFSLELNNAIDQSNKTRGIPGLVREKANYASQIDILRNILPDLKERKWKEVVVGKEMTSNFLPYWPSNKVKYMMKNLRKKKRDLENKIRESDATVEIELSVSFEEIDEYLI